VIAVALDTDVLIDHLRDKTGSGAASQLLRLVQDNRVLGYVSVITVGELVVGAQRTGKLAQLRHLLRLFHRKNVTSTIAEHAGMLRAGSLVRGRALTLLDAMIAATALNVRAAHLVTRNVADYQGGVGKLSVIPPTEAVQRLERMGVSAHTTGRAPSP
jgi:predicted nucleic acid-binding protein